MPEFIAVDGEADDQGRYVLLCDSTGRVLHNPKGIETREALLFLLELGGHGSKRQVVCFGLNYDVNQWLVSIQRGELMRLAETGKTTWQLRFKLDWLPGKYFAISDRKTHCYVKVCEVFGFFQSSFVKALETWGMKAPVEVQRMKRKRGTFTASELDRVIRYCQAECRLLVQLMNQLAEACYTAGCAPKRDWIGAGSIASSLLRANGVHAHHAYDADLAPREQVEELILGAYYGARVELLAQGTMKAGQTRDIRSAYPHAATRLPSLTGAVVKRRKRYRPEADWAIWRVRWENQVHGQLAPFPVRQPDGTIHYPASGEGCYHAVEVRQALALGYTVKVLEGLELIPGTADLPFDWIGRVYRHRARLKQAGDPAEKALKLGMNSVYGKLAQGYGITRPPFQNYWWAGHITAATRARMLQAAHQSTHPVMIATDGLFCLRTPIRGAQRPDLGSWEPALVDDLFCAQPGVYTGVRDGREVIKSRGFFAREVDYQQLREGFEREGWEYTHHYLSRRFIGLKVALHRTAGLKVWRQWVEEPRTITLEPQRKVIRQAELTHPSTGMVLLFPPDGPLVSVPYRPKQSLYDDPTDTQLENMVADDQPHHDLTGD